MVVAVSWIILHGLSRARPTSFLRSRLRQLHLTCLRPRGRLSHQFPTSAFSAVRRSVIKLCWAKPPVFLWASARGIWWKQGTTSTFIFSLLGWRLASCRDCLLVGCKSRRHPSRLDNYGVHPGKTEPNSKFDWSKLWEVVSPDIILLLLAAASAIVVAILNIQIPLVLGNMVNVIAGLDPGAQLQWYLMDLRVPGMRLAGIYVLQSVFTFFYVSLLSSLGERCAVRLRCRLFQSLMEQDVAFFDSHRVGELVNRLSADVQDFKSSFKMVVSQGLRSVTQTVGCIVSLLIISPQMTAVIGVTVPVMVTIGTVFGRQLRSWSQEAQSQVAMATAVADEALGNMRTVRAFAMEDKEQELYSDELHLSSWLNQRLGFGIALFQALSNFAINGLVLGVLSHGGLLLAANQISAGSLMAFLVATQTIQKSLANLSVLFGQLVRGMTAGSRVFEYLEVHPEIALVGGTTIPRDQLVGKVEFQNVTFSYPSRQNQEVLRDFSLKLAPGCVTALCGLSGAGKSTVAALLERFYDPQEGEVFIDGCSLRSLDPSWVRGKLIGYINQEPVLFGTTILENIRYGNQNATDEQVYEAAKLANADSFIRSFKDGYHTVVGERGVALSGGQKQRVAIARALLKDPRILILDEATSALDALSEHRVQQALDHACSGRTVLVIAHRLNTIQDAHRIAVLHHGQLKELGSHQDLLKKHGFYYELVRRQTLDEKLDEGPFYM